VFQRVSLEDLASHCHDHTRVLLLGRKNERTAVIQRGESCDLLVSNASGGVRCEVAPIVIAVCADRCSHLGAYHGERPGRCHFRGEEVHDSTGFVG
jgi:hypothetical protein